MKIGGYMSTTIGVDRAIREMHAMGGNCIMIYNGSPQSTKRKFVNPLEFEKAEQAKQELGFGETIIHAPYIANLCSPEEEKRDMAIEIITHEVKMTPQMKSNLLVVHPGNCIDFQWNDAISRLLDSLNRVINATLDEDVTICIETMSGKGSEIMYCPEHFGQLFEQLEHPERVGVCFDTCHVFASGYFLSPTDLQATLDKYAKYFDLEKIKVMHINGSLYPRKSYKDRHANIGTDEDYIGVEALKNICNLEQFKDVPKILETPWIDKRYTNYAKEIKLLKGEN